METTRVDDWERFLEENDVNLVCRVCQGTGKVRGRPCKNCDGDGHFEPMTSVIFNTGFSKEQAQTIGKQLPYAATAGGVIVFEHNADIWFALGGCGMDMTPYLAAAWVELAPDVVWMPEEFLVTGTNLRSGYISAVVGDKWARKIHAVMAKHCQHLRMEAAMISRDLKEARALLRAKKEGRAAA